MSAPSLQRRLAVAFSVVAALGLAACGGGGGGSSGSSTSTSGASGAVDSTGGTVAVASGPLSGSGVDIPATALSVTTTVALAAGTAVTSAGFAGVGPAVHFTPDGTTFAVPVTGSVPFVAGQIPAGKTTGDIVVLKRTESTGAVTTLAPTHVDAAAGLVSFATSSFSTFEAEVGIPPAAPTGLAAHVISSGEVDLSWSSASSWATGFRVERSPAGAGTFASIGSVGATTLAFSDTTVAASTSYDYRVFATSANGDSPASSVASATTPAPATPAAPSALAATAVSPTAIDLSWTNNATNQTGFEVERSAHGAGTFARVATTTATTYHDTSVSETTTYDYRVRATNAAGPSGYSNVASATTPLGVPAAPSGLGATAISFSEIDLAWTNHATNQAEFKVERSAAGAGVFAQIATASAAARAYADTSVAPATGYDYRVRASNAAGDSAASNVASATTPALPGAPTAPTNLVATPVSTTSVNLIWARESSKNETGFKIERSPGGAGTFSLLNTTAAGVTVYADTTVTTGNTYDYRVRATDAGGDSVPSNLATAVALYDIVYVRYVRHGDNPGNNGQNEVDLPDGEQPYVIDAGASLMLRHPDGTEEVLVACAASGANAASVQDPTISLDGTTVIYAKYVGIVTTENWWQLEANCFLFKMQIHDVSGNVIPAAQRVEVQLTDGSTGFATDKLAGNTANDAIGDFGIRDLGPAQLPDGRIVFTSNREAVVSFRQGVGPDLDAITAGTASQLTVVDDSNTPNRNLHLLGYANLHQVQHPTVLADGRIAFTNWDDAGLRFQYGMETVYTCDPDGSNLSQFLEPHDFHKRVDHFVAQLSTGHVLVVDYYPFMRLWGFGVLHRYALGLSAPLFMEGDQESENDFRFFSRLGLDSFTPHTDGEDYLAGNSLTGEIPNSGRYSQPAAGPHGKVWVAYSPGGVTSGSVNTPASNPTLDSGIYSFENAGSAVITNPSQLTLVTNSASWNEMWPRPVVTYQQVHGIPTPATVTPVDGLGPSAMDRGLVADSPIAIAGTSSMHNRESAYLGGTDGNAFFTDLTFREGAPAFGVQGTDVGSVKETDLWGVRVIAVTPDRYHQPYSLSSAEQDVASNQFVMENTSFATSVKGFFSHHGERWKILGEFPVVNPSGAADPSGQPDTSFLARVPANTPFFFQGIDSRGMTLFTEQTWRHVPPGHVMADCGGCHAHAIAGVPFTGKYADAPAHLVDLISSTPLLSNATGSPVVVTHTAKLVSVEFRRDVYPILRDNCTPCHVGTTPPGGAHLSLFDSSGPGAVTATPTLAQAARPWKALAADSVGKYAVGTTIPGGQSSYLDPQVSRYVRTIQARMSLIAWRLYNQRLDGYTNAEFPVSGDSSTADIDFQAAVNCTAASITPDQKGLITRWIDLGCPIDFDRPKETYTGDGLLPVLTASLYDNGAGATQLRVGLLDIESGIDTTTLSVAIAVGGSTTTLHFADLAFDAPNALGRATVSIDPQTIASQGAHLTASVKDKTGNLERIDRVFTAALRPAPTP